LNCIPSQGLPLATSLQDVERLGTSRLEQYVSPGPREREPVELGPIGRVLYEGAIPADQKIHTMIERIAGISTEWKEKLDGRSAAFGRKCDAPVFAGPEIGRFAGQR